MVRTGKRRRLRHLLFAVILIGYTGFILLDTFVIPKGRVRVADLPVSEAGADTGENAGETVHQEVVKEAAATDMCEEAVSAGTGSGTVATDTGNENVQTDTGNETVQTGTGNETVQTGVSDETTGEPVSVSVTEMTVAGTQVYVADIYLSDPSYLMTAVADDTFGRNVTAKTSVIAEENNAVLAINGDFYGFRDSGYVMRNGYLYRSTARSGSGNEDLVIYEDGTMEIIDESEVSAEELAAGGAVQIFSFGPGLVSDGEISVDPNTEVDQSMRSNPRTAIGMITQGHYVMVVSDGRTSESEGLTLYELAGVMRDLGCTVAYNLDGGGSTTMYYNGEVVNNPTTNGNRIRERKVSDIVYIAA